MTEKTKELIDKLIEKKEGFVYWDEIFSAVEEEDDLKTAIAEAVDRIKKNGLKISEKEEATSDNKHNEKNESYTSDSVRVYMTEIGKYPLLTREEEIKLIKKIDSDGNAAISKFISSNLRLAASIARKYYTPNGFFDFQDLIQEANIGLLKAVTKFDPAMGCKFSTYATYWIKQNITRAIADCGKSIRLPVHLHDDIRKYNKAIKNLESRLFREPTIEEIASELNWSANKTFATSQYKQNIRSLNESVGENDGTELEDFIKDEDIKDPYEETEKIFLSDSIKKAISSLTPREQKIIIDRFGLEDEMPKTLEEVGERYGVTRERIRQIESKALRKLRHPARSKLLK